MAFTQKEEASFTAALCTGLAAGSLLLPALAGAAPAFEEVTAVAGPFKKGESWGAGAWGDLDGDRWPDLFHPNHRHPSTMYRNNGDGTFSDVTAAVDSSGAMRQLTSYVTRDTHGAAWGDFDNDGDQDLMVMAGRRSRDQLYVNEGGVLPDRTALYGFPAKRITADFAGRTPTWLDYDNEGRLDLAPVVLGQVPLMRQGADSFINSATSAGLAWSKGQYAQLTDLTGDGRLDLLGVYQNSFPRKAYDISRLPFRDITATIPRTPYVIDSLPGDFDGDLDTDLLLVRSRWFRLEQAKMADADTFEAQLHANQKTVSFNSAGRVTFDISADTLKRTDGIYIGSTGWHPTSFNFTLSPTDTRVSGLKSHDPARPKAIYIGFDPATSLWRIQNGGYLNAYFVVDSTSNITNLNFATIPADERPHAPVLLSRTATGFTDRSTAAGINTPVHCLTGAAADFDNDMDLDLYLVCRNGVENLPNILYENLGDGSFRALPGAGGAAGRVGMTVSDGAGTGDGVSVADYDVDGFPDLFVTNGNNLNLRQIGPHQLFRNLGNANHWIEIDLQGSGTSSGSNRDGIGAVVYVTAGGRTQMREQGGGMHLWTQNHQRLHFGLGSNTQAAEVRVQWPNGAVDTFTGVAADRLYLARQGATALAVR